MDETGMTGLYLFHGPLGIFGNEKDREEFIAKRARENNVDVEEYRKGYLLSVVHQQALLAGYRTQDAKSFKQEVKSRQESGRMLFGPIFNFRKAFDEIDYHQAPCVQVLRNYPEVFAKNPEERELLYQIESFITHYTFGQRVMMMF